MMTNIDSNIARRGLLLVLTAPSGCGKSTITRAIMEEDPSIMVSVSATTRSPRPGEVEGEHYYFMSAEDFKGKVDQKEFLEWAEVFGKFYGTPKEPVEQALSAGKDVFFDIDWQGAEQLQNNAAEDLVWICILPPTKQSLEDRLRARGQDSEETIAKRMLEAQSESSHWVDADYVVVNDDLEKATNQIKAILQAERLKRVRRTGLADFVKTM
ncbi:guanylate kinase [Candidatus Terasakiella magnetica]|uniref:Guanylate kinase n=1 Tax=Candidatus Terasakiella magnetica TaxID=1867952 RepID=A0A1C3RJX3_9PROT|nr:guanylate kinase [Candidatus Terasakiella magnetica]SCA57565.1 guanylate kinase [Candidatus Terasakiella magnetica]